MWNYSDGWVNGRSDLEDFFPVWLDLHQVLNVLPPISTVEYKLSQADDAVNAVYTDLTKGDHAGDYLIADGSTTYGPSFNQNSRAATVVNVTASGVALNTTFLNKIQSNANKGVLLIEGSRATTEPLVLEIWKDGQKIYKKEMPLSLSGVQKMFRYANLRSFAGDNNPGDASNVSRDPPNNPDSTCNNQQVVFIHGFNETHDEALGDISEVFKRLYWSGSRAKFTGVQWFGDQGFPAATHFHWDVTNAFVTAPYFANLLSNRAANGDEVNVIAFSLGNMVASSAIHDHGATPTRYFMLHAAVAKEVYDEDEYDSPSNEHMEEAEWRPYDHKLYASEWCRLWDSAPTDGRYALTWQGRCAGAAGPQTYNFYSSGDEILDNLHQGGIDLAALQGAVRQFGRGSWCAQELLKGRVADVLGGSTYGGWAFNLTDYSVAPNSTSPWDPSSASGIPPDVLKTNPFFEMDDPWLSPLFQEPDDPSGPGSQFAQVHRGRLIGEMIPALSFATGRNLLGCLGGLRNFDMNGFYVQPGYWPASRMGSNAQSDWLHGDYRYVAYPYEVLAEVTKWAEL